MWAMEFDKDVDYLTPFFNLFSWISYEWTCKQNLNLDEIRYADDTTLTFATT